jgi:NADPH:quinone reductase-like Zn-dependent oxidoreductase
MKAVVQEGSGSADVLHLRDVDEPDITDDGVLVRVRAASVNAADWHTVHGGAVIRLVGRLLRVREVPIRGGDLAGVVEKTGKNVTRFKAGDEVFGAAPGSFAELVAANEGRISLKPAGLSSEEAAAIPGAGCTALQGLRDHGHVQPGQRVLVYGAGGGVGTFAVQIATALGGHVTAVTSTRNLEVVQSLGAAEVIDYNKDDVARRPGRYDVVFDVASTRPVAEMMRLVAPGGTYVLAGAAKGGMFAIIRRLAAVQLRSRLLRQRAATFLARIIADDLAVLSQLVEAGKLRPVIDRAYPLSETVEAVRYVGTGEARAKVVITVG